MKILKRLTSCIFVCLVSKFTAAQPCSCKNDLKQLQEKVENNYAGFNDKVTVKTKTSYQQLISSLEKKALSSISGRTCQLVLQQYIGFFKDGHLALENRYPQATRAVSYKKLPAVDMDQYFRQLQLTDSDIRGIWKNDTYEIGIVKSPAGTDGYEAVIINSKNENWKRGMVKMRLKRITDNYYKAEYFTGDFTKEETKIFFKANIMDILLVGVFEKTTPEVRHPIVITNYTSVFPVTPIKFTFPDDSTAILFLGSFNNQYESVIDSLMQINKSALEARPNWIIDISYNGGGGTGSYRSILPYLFTDTIKRSGSYYRLSPDNVYNYKKTLADNPKLPPNVSAFLNKLVIAGIAKPGSWFFDEGKLFSFPAVQTNPKQIAVLTSNQTASSGEIFIMDARQSKKVTVFGSKTAGVVDYGDGTDFYIGCDSLLINIPARKSAYLKDRSYDNVGLKPDVAIPDTVLSPYTVILNYYKSKKNK